jgi:SAM-dependent methyltransferase
MTPQELAVVIDALGVGLWSHHMLYPPEVNEVVAIEPEPMLRSHAESAAEKAHVPIHVLAGVAEELPLEDGRADAVVASLVLCSVADQPRALAEIRGVVRPEAVALLRARDPALPTEAAAASGNRLQRAHPAHPRDRTTHLSPHPCKGGRRSA